MDNAAAISAVNRALAHYRRRQAHTPTDHSAGQLLPCSYLLPAKRGGKRGGVLDRADQREGRCTSSAMPAVLCE